MKRSINAFFVEFIEQTRQISSIKIFTDIGT